MPQQLINGINNANGQVNVPERDAINNNFAQLFNLAGNGNFTNVTEPTYTILITDDFINCDCSSNNITLTLPAALNKVGKKIKIRKSDSSDSTVTVNTYGDETINGNYSYVIKYANTVMELESDGTNWVVV